MVATQRSVSNTFATGQLIDEPAAEPPSTPARRPRAVISPPTGSAIPSRRAALTARFSRCPQSTVARRAPMARSESAPFPDRFTSGVGLHQEAAHSPACDAGAAQGVGRRGVPLVLAEPALNNPPQSAPPRPRSLPGTWPRGLSPCPQCPATLQTGGFETRVMLSDAKHLAHCQRGHRLPPNLQHLQPASHNHANFQVAKSPSPCAQGEGLG